MDSVKRSFNSLSKKIDSYVVLLHTIAIIHLSVLFFDVASQPHKHKHHRTMNFEFSMIITQICIL